MITVIKKDGRKEDFMLSKMATSIINAAADLNIQLSIKDAEIISKDVENKVTSLRGEDAITSSYELRQIMSDVLKHSGFKDLERLYNEKVDNKFPK